MAERPNEPSNPKRPELDPEGRPLPPRNSVVTPPPNPGRGSGLFIAAIVVILLIIAGIFYASGPSTIGGTAPQQAQSQQSDNMATGSTTNAPAQLAPKAPATNAPASPATNTAPTNGPNPQ